MNTYRVEITEILTLTVEIEADETSEAVQKVKDKWYKSDHILSADNFSDVTFTVVENAN